MKTRSILYVTAIVFISVFIFSFITLQTGCNKTNEQTTVVGFPQSFADLVTKVKH